MSDGFSRRETITHATAAISGYKLGNMITGETQKETTDSSNNQEKQTKPSIQKLQDQLNKRKNYISEYPGRTVIQGDPNKRLEPKYIGRFQIRAYKPGEDPIKEYFEENYEKPEDFVRNPPNEINSEEVMHIKNNHWNNLRENKIKSKLVHLEEDGENIDLEKAVRKAEEEFNEVLGNNYDVEFDYLRTEPDKEDNEILEETANKDQNYQFSRNKLKNKYADRQSTALFLVDRDLREGSRGHASAGQIGFVELTGNQKQDLSTIIHESGHLELDLPHNFLPEGVMSYNSVGETSFNEYSQMYADALKNAELDAELEVNDSEDDDSVIHYGLQPETIDIEDEQVQNLMFETLEHFVEDRLNYGMEEWLPEHYSDRDEELMSFHHKESHHRLKFYLDTEIEEVKLESY